MPIVTTNLETPGHALLDMGNRVEVPTWQALDVKGKPQGATIELMNTTLCLPIPDTVEELQNLCTPNLPWAEKQFLERVSGEPLNPGDTYYEWPWFAGNVDQHRKKVDAEQANAQFSHTYMERYWPKHAGDHNSDTDYDDVRLGVRFKYGDLSDVIDLLAREPATRQAYLPIFFPEDTGAHHGQRIPCTLGYLFLLREGKLHITYYIRSCDFLRHFRDDVYMTARLCQWVLDKLKGEFAPHEPEEAWADVKPGHLTMHIGSLHVFEGDLPKLRREYGSH